MIRLSFTYDVVTPESAEQGATADHGFYAAGGWRYSLLNPIINADTDANPDVYRRPWGPGDLRASVETARDLGIYEPSCGGDIQEGTWWSSVDGDIDYSTGAETNYAFHISGCTLATRRRIGRLLTA